MLDSKQLTVHSRRQDLREAVLTGAVWACAATWLVSLLLAVFWAVDQEYHPFAFVFSLILLPTLTVVGTLLGAAGGFVLALWRQRRRTVAEIHPEYISRLLQRGTVMIAAGTAIMIIGLIVSAELEYQQVAKLVSLGGSIDPVGGEVSFPAGVLSDSELPAIVKCLNECKDWYYLDLIGTDVTGDGLRHLQNISKESYYLGLSPDQLDENGLEHVRRLSNLANLDEINAAAADREKSRQNSLPGGE